MTAPDGARILTDERGRFVVRYRIGPWVGDYVALSEADAARFAADPAAWQQDRDLAVAKWRAGRGAGVGA